MIRNVSPEGNLRLSADLEKYVAGKLDSLERAIPRKLRRFAHAEVRFDCHVVKGKKENTCVLTLRLPREAFAATETTQHIYAALDIATANISEQLAAYKAARPDSLRSRLGRWKHPD